MQGRDYAIAIRAAHIMQKLGLVDVDVRMNDRVDFVTTQSEKYDKRKHDFIEWNGWTSCIEKSKRESMVLHLMSHGLSRKEAEDYCGRNDKIAGFFSDNPTAGYTSLKGQIISYGKKSNP